jgi:hypothetical protein
MISAHHRESFATVQGWFSVRDRSAYHAQIHTASRTAPSSDEGYRAHRAHIAHKKNLRINWYGWAGLSLCVMCVMCVIFSQSSMEIKSGQNDAKTAKSGLICPS